jgi:hypothetical protein
MLSSRRASTCPTNHAGDQTTQGYSGQPLTQGRRCRAYGYFGPEQLLPRAPPSTRGNREPGGGDGGSAPLGGDGRSGQGVDALAGQDVPGRRPGVQTSKDDVNAAAVAAHGPASAPAGRCLSASSPRCSARPLGAGHATAWPMPVMCRWRRIGERSPCSLAGRLVSSLGSAAGSVFALRTPGEADYVGPRH